MPRPARSPQATRRGRAEVELTVVDPLKPSNGPHRSGPSPMWRLVEPDWWTCAAGDLTMHLRSHMELGWIASVQDGAGAIAATGHAHSYERAVLAAEGMLAVSERIAAAVNDGVVLDISDKRAIFNALREAHELRALAGGRSAAEDPMRKGDAFPMGVGFTRMTKRAEQRIDASVRRAGENAAMYSRADGLERRATELLAGIGTAAHKARKAANRLAFQRGTLAMLMDKPLGKRVGEFVVERVTISRDRYPSSCICSGPGLIKGVNDKFDLARMLFDGDREALKRMVDEIRDVGSAHVDGEGGAPEAKQGQPRERERG